MSTFLHIQTKNEKHLNPIITLAILCFFSTTTLKASESDDLFQRGWDLYTGKNGSIDERGALELFAHSCKLGSAKALVRLHICRQAGFRLPHPYTDNLPPIRADTYRALKQEAVNGDATAESLLGICLLS